MRLVLPALAIAACTPMVNVGSDVKLSEDTSCEVVTAPAVECPPEPWGDRLTLGSVDALQTRLVGRWGFCGGEKRYTGRGVLAGFAQGRGVEFWVEGGQLRYAFLRGTAPDYVRDASPAASGTARLSVESGRGQAVLVAADGREAAWGADFFAGQPVLQNAAFDVWNFVPLQ